MGYRILYAFGTDHDALIEKIVSTIDSNTTGKIENDDFCIYPGVCFANFLQDRSRSLLKFKREPLFYLLRARKEYVKELIEFINSINPKYIHVEESASSNYGKFVYSHNEHVVSEYNLRTAYYIPKGNGKNPAASHKSFDVDSILLKINVNVGRYSLLRKFYIEYIIMAFFRCIEIHDDIHQKLSFNDKIDLLDRIAESNRAVRYGHCFVEAPISYNLNKDLLREIFSLDRVKNLPSGFRDISQTPIISCLLSGVKLEKVNIEEDDDDGYEGDLEWD